MRSMKNIILFSLSIVILFSNCANRLFVSEKRWKDMHDVTIYSNADNISVSNKYGENIGYLNKGENTLTIDALKRYNKKLIFSHPNRKDTTIILKRKVRGGALLLDLFIFYPAIVYDFAKGDIYKLKRSSKVIKLNMQYTDEFYEMEYKLLKNTNNPNDLMTYVTKYPNSPFKEKVENKMYELAYEKSKSLNTVDAYEKHNSEFPESPYKNEIQTKIYELAYNDALTKNTVDAYEKYIAKYPNSPKVNEATQNKNKIKEIDEAYEIAKKSNDYKALKKFIETYKTTKYHYEILQKMLNAYCEENKNKLKNLNETNNAIKELTEMQDKYGSRADNWEILFDLRDTYILQEISKCKTKTEYFALLTNQCNIENNRNDATKSEALNIKDRVFNNKLVIKNGEYNLWLAEDEKLVVNYQNNKINGNYIKYASDEKTILESGTYVNGTITGKYLINYNNGKKHFEQNWINGYVQTEIEFDENGINLTAKREEERAKLEEEKKIAEEKAKKEKEPKEGYNYWVSKEEHNCAWCGKTYIRKKTKYKSSEVMQADYLQKKGLFGYLDGLLDLAFNLNLTIYEPFEDYCSQRCSVQK